MKLLRVFHFGLAAALGAILLLSHSCSAVGEVEASSSVASPPKEPKNPPPVNKFYTLLDPQRIASLNSRYTVHPNVDYYPEAPIYEGTHLLKINTPVQEVEQALREFGSVGIVDRENRDARLIKYGQGMVVPELFRDTNRVLWIDSLPKDVHILAKYVRWNRRPDYPVKMPLEQDISHLPYADGVPILQDPHDTLGYMMRASRDRTGKFWHLREGHESVLIDPRAGRDGDLARPASVLEGESITRVLTGFGKDRERYNDALASILWGAPTELSGDREARMRKIPLSEYPRLGRDATRAAMINALQTKGRFRFYDGRRGSGGPFKVKVTNPDAFNSEQMEVSVKPLSAFEKSTESLYAAFGKLRRPA
nr:effect [Ustilago esculenta]